MLEETVYKIPLPKELGEAPEYNPSNSPIRRNLHPGNKSTKGSSSKRPVAKRKNSEPRK